MAKPRYLCSLKLYRNQPSRNRHTKCACKLSHPICMGILHEKSGSPVQQAVFVILLRNDDGLGSRSCNASPQRQAGTPLPAGGTREDVMEGGRKSSIRFLRIMSVAQAMPSIWLLETDPWRLRE